MRTEEAFLIGIENSDKGYFRKVKTFTKQIDTDKYVINALSQVIHDLHTL